jgi:hypothetical protein
MDGAELEALAQSGKRLCVSSVYFSHRKVLGSTDLSRFALKVVPETPNVHRDLK